MSRRGKRTPPSSPLRERAEQVLKKTRRQTARLSADAAQELVHELQVHQIELEMQNDELRHTQLELELARDRYANLYDFAPSAHLTLGDRSEILEANLAAAALLGLDRDKLLHQKLTRFIATDSQDEFYLLTRRVLSSNARQGGELDVVKATGTRLRATIEGIAAEPKGSGGSQWRATLTDITERKQMEEALTRREAGLAKAQEIAQMGSFEQSSPPSPQDHWSAESLRILGLKARPASFSLEQFIARSVVPEDHWRVRTALNDLVLNRTPTRVGIRIARPDGAVRHLELSGEGTFDPAGRLTKLSFTLQDLTERRKLEQQVIEISDQEQRRIGRDLHDDLCQYLYGITVMGQTLSHKLARQASMETAAAAEIARLGQEANQRARRLAAGLCPVVQGPGGLARALQELALHTRKLFNLDCNFRAQGFVPGQNDDVATHLYRIAQEAISNAAKHGKAREVLIKLSGRAGRISLSIVDNGIGIQATRRRRDGMGLRLMQYRSDMIGGALAILPNPKGGTIVRCSLNGAG